MQEAKMVTNHLHYFGAGFLLCHQSSVNGISNSKFYDRVIVFREQLPGRPLVEAVEALRKLVGIDLAGAPTPKFILELRQLGRELAFISDAAELA